MPVRSTEKLTVDQYFSWAPGQEERTELYAGTVYAMAPGRAGQARTKFAVQTALRAGIGRAGLPCHLLPTA